nr:hypothetical protein SHINE37_50012 [Rhizobiaceae bacterium]
MRLAIIERESRPVRAMTREERLEHIWSSTAELYRGYADYRWPHASRGRRTRSPSSVANWAASRNCSKP